MTFTISPTQRGFFFPLKIKQKTKTHDLPATITVFADYSRVNSRGFPKGSAVPKTILKAINKEDHSAKCFWESSHRSMGGRLGVLSSSICPVFLLLVVLFCTFLFFCQCNGHSPSTRRDKLTPLWRSHYWKVHLEAGPTLTINEWQDERMCLKQTNKQTKKAAPLEGDSCPIHVTDNNCGWRVHEVVLSHSQVSTINRTQRDGNQSVSQSIKCTNTLQTPYRWYKCLVTMYEVNISVSV